jgi:hypothetical protein
MTVLQTPDAIIEHVEQLITNGNAQIVHRNANTDRENLAHRRRSFLESVTIPNLPPSTPEQEFLASEYITICYIQNIENFFSNMHVRCTGCSRSGSQAVD